MRQMLRLPSLRPRSLSGLILLGFAVVALPLLVALVSAAVEMRNLAAASERLVLNGVAATQYTQALVRQVASLERTARLYQIIPRPALLEAFEQNRELLLHSLENFGRLPGDPERQQVIERMRVTVLSIAQGLGSGTPGNVARAVKEFTQLSNDAGRLSKQPNPFERGASGPACGSIHRRQWLRFGEGP